VAVIGDSHAAMLLPGITDQLPQLGWSLDTFVGYGCQWSASKSSDCATEMLKVQRELLDPRHHVDVVITTAARWARGSNATRASEAYSAMWKPVAASGTKIIVVADNPTVTAETLQCLSRVGNPSGNSACATPRSVALADTDALIKGAALTPGVILVDLTPFFCGAKSCPAVIGGEIVYRDSAGHITATYSRSLAPFLVQRIGKALADSSTEEPPRSSK
jgi:hypothetical protein